LAEGNFLLLAPNCFDSDASKFEVELTDEENDFGSCGTSSGEKAGRKRPHGAYGTDGENGPVQNPTSVSSGSSANVLVKDEPNMVVDLVAIGEKEEARNHKEAFNARLVKQMEDDPTLKLKLDAFKATDAIDNLDTPSPVASLTLVLAVTIPTPLVTLMLNRSRVQP